MSDSPTPALPASPHLNWLKNRGKEKLKQLRNGDPTKKLADAHLAVAREYGFASWRKLKAHIEALHNHGNSIVQAVSRGDLPVIARILDQHPQLVNAAIDREERVLPSDAHAMRLIHVAVAENQIAAARLLIERGTNLNLRNADGRLAIHDCFELGRDEIQLLLLSACAELDACAAAAWNKLDVLRSILQRDPAAANDLTTHTSPLGWVGYHPGRAEAAELLLAHGAIVNRAPYDEQALRPTAMVGNAPVLRVLLGHGADPNWRSKDGDTLMHIAIRSRLVDDPLEYIRVLLDAGGDASARNKAGHTALDEAIAMHEKPIEEHATRKVIGTKRYERIIELLRSRTKPSA